MWPEPEPPLKLLASQTEWRRFRPGLDRVKNALRALDHPHERYEHVLVGGTNGKGTVSLNLARALPGRVGLFQSPHVVDVRERITIDGEWVPDACWQEAEREVYRRLPRPELSYFEWLLVIAVQIFAKAEVDRAVFEVGLGGRWDATNALRPRFSLITNVGWDHMEILGPDLESIALEKIEIGRAGRPLLLPRSLQAMQKVQARLEAMGCLVRYYEDRGEFEDNRRLVERALQEWGLADRRKHWLLPPGRRERMDLGAGLFLDGAHNQNGWTDMVRWLDRVHGRPIPILASLSRGRDPELFLRILEPIREEVWVWPVGFERELPLSQWPQGVRPIHGERLDSLLEKPLLVCGSLYLVGAFKRWLAGRGPGQPSKTDNGTRS